jgi:hypothetical protein
VPNLTRSFRALCAAIVAVGLLAGCGGGSHGSGASMLPTLATAGAAAKRATAGAGTNVVAIDAGGAAAGSFSADQYFATSSWTYKTSSAINTGALTNPAPQAVYQSEREGAAVTYTIPGLTAGAPYTVTLSFAETWFTSAGQRVFNIGVNGASVLKNFDIFSAAGARNTVVTKSFPATASATGTVTIGLTAVTNNAVVSAIEIASAAVATPTPTATPAATPPPSGTLLINAGGAAAGTFTTDQNFATSSWTYKTASTIDTSGLTNPAPAAVFADEREGAAITYTIPGLTAGATYAVRLDFAELWFTAAGQRVFNVSINGASALSNYDVFAAAGARFKAIAPTFSATANASGTIVIGLTAVANYAAINGIEITPGGGAGPTPVPTATPALAGFNDYVTFGYDNQRDVFNPNSTTITPAALANVHLAWQAPLGGGDYNTQTQPMLATQIAGHAGVLFVGGGSGNVYGYDALSGALLWTRNTGQEQFTCENNYAAYFGVGGSVAYDPASRSLYAVGNGNASPNAVASNSLYHLDGASGAILGQVNFAPASAGWPSLDFSHTSVTLGSNGLAYVGTSATCDISSWRGRIAAVSVPSMTLANTFFPVWNGTSQPWGGGGVWGWGGVSLDFSGNVLTGIGNTDDGSTTHGSIVAPFVRAPAEYSGLGDAFIKVSPDLSTLVDSHHPIPVSAYGGIAADLDLNGTPAVFRPNGTGCNPMAALQAKSGSLYLYDTTRIGSGLVGQYQLAPSSYADGFLGGPAFSPATGLLYAGVSSSSGSLYPPGMIAINPGCGSPSVAWHSAFGPDSYPSGIARSVPAVSAGGVVLVGTLCSPDGSGGCSGSTATAAVSRTAQGARRKPSICCAPPGSSGGAVWALDASTGALLNGGNPLITTSAPLRVPPTIDGSWIFVLDNSGDMYALTIDPHVVAVAARTRAVSARMITHWATPRAR